MDDVEPQWPPDMDSAIFEGGLADGAIRTVALDAQGQPPPMVAWRGDGVYVGASEDPAPPRSVLYELAVDVTYPTARWVYRHVGPLDA